MTFHFPVKFAVLISPSLLMRHFRAAVLRKPHSRLVVSLLEQQRCPAAAAGAINQAAVTILFL